MSNLASLIVAPAGKMTADDAHFTAIAQDAEAHPQKTPPPHPSSPNAMAFSVGLWARAHNVRVYEVHQSRGYQWVLNGQFRLDFKDSNTEPAVKLLEQKQGRLAAYEGPGVDHTLLSPSGRVSKRARKAADERTRRELFGPGSGFEGWGEIKQPSDRERLLTQATRLRELAARGMSPRKYTREAERLEDEAAKVPA